MFFLSVVQLSAAFDGRKVKLLVVIFVFSVANFKILQNLNGLILVPPVVTFCKVYVVKRLLNYQHVPDINSIKGFLTI